MRLLLVDGHAAAYRFFFGIRPLSTSDGFPLQAIFGFVRLIQQLRAQWQPTHLAVAFDGGLPQSRLQLVPQYKAQRKPMPDELRQQLPVLFEYLGAASLVSLRQDEVEADDVIGTLARRFEGETLIATGDKDLFQLVDANTRIVPLSGDDAPLTAEGVLQKTGVPPHRIPDWLALIGDTADNIPGVPGVGPKTAATLVGMFDSLDTMFAQIDKIPQERLRDKLWACQPLIIRNRRMVELDCAIPGMPGIDALRVGPEPVAALLSFFRKYELHTFEKQLREPDLFA